MPKPDLSGKGFHQKYRCAYGLKFHPDLSCDECPKNDHCDIYNSIVARERYDEIQDREPKTISRHRQRHR